MPKGRVVFRAIESFCWIIGVSLLTIYAVVRADGEIGRDAALENFAEARASAEQASSTALQTEAERQAELTSQPTPNMSLWDQGRISGYWDSLEENLGIPEAVLEIPSVDLVVPVFHHTSEVALNRGAGRIEGTPGPGVDGNTGIAGHRDGYFRPLKDVSIGDRVILQTFDETLTYRIAETLIVDPADTSVLEDTEELTVTLVTCYPFYYVGHAPQRFIVRGVLEERQRAVVVSETRDPSHSPTERMAAE